MTQLLIVCPTSLTSTCEFSQPPHSYTIVYHQNLLSILEFRVCRHVTSAETPDNSAFLRQNTKNHISVQTDRTYCLHFPWKEITPPPPPPTSNDMYTICFKQTRSLVHRPAKQPKQLKAYGEIIKEQVKWALSKSREQKSNT